MKAFLVPIYCQTNSLSQEKLTLGLILLSVNESGEPKIFFKLSEKKIQVVEKLMDAAGVPVSKSFFTTTEKYIQNVVKEVEHNGQTSLSLGKSQVILNEEIYNYLAKYAHGLVEFGNLKPIGGQINAKTFQKLFADFTGDYSAFQEDKPKKFNLYYAVKKQLQDPKLKEKADIGFQFTPNKLPGILKPTKVELITVNGKVESLHALDFDSNPDTVSNHLYEYEVFYHALQKFVSSKSELDKLTIAFKKPEPKTDQEKLFNKAIKNKSTLFNFLPVDEIDDFTKAVQTKDYHKFSEVFAEEL